MTIALFIAAVVCYTISQAAQHGKLEHWPDGFWGTQAYRRKYKRKPTLTLAPKNWYYTFFKIPYRELFPGSATIFVFLTDGYHLSQAAFKVFLCLTIAMHEPFFNWWIDSLIFFAMFSIVFTLVYKLLSK